MDNEPVSEEERVQAVARFGPAHNAKRLKEVHHCQTIKKQSASTLLRRVWSLNTYLMLQVQERLLIEQQANEKLQREKENVSQDLMQVEMISQKEYAACCYVVRS